MIVHVLGVPMDLGSGRRGVDMGPSAIRIAGLDAALRDLGHTVIDDGDIAIKNMEELKVGDVHARYLAEITRASTVACRKVDRIMSRGHFPLVLGGDHSIAAGTVSGIASFARREGKKVGLLWVDAHGDINTPDTSPGSVQPTPVGHGRPRAGLPEEACVGTGDPTGERGSASPIHSDLRAEDRRAGKFHPIRVEVKNRPDLHVRTRQGYWPVL